MAGTVDFPTRDPRYSGVALPARILDLLKAQRPGTYARPANFGYQAWRCIDGAVYACYGGGTTCDYAEWNNLPTPAMIAFCEEHPEVTYMPHSVSRVSIASVYEWGCNQGAPKTSPLRQVDAQGFLAGEWHRVP